MTYGMSPDISPRTRPEMCNFLKTIIFWQMLQSLLYDKIQKLSVPICEIRIQITISMAVGKKKFFLLNSRTESCFQSKLSTKGNELN